MNNNWSTRHIDMQAAEQIIADYAHQSNSEALGLFELFVNKEAKCMNFRLSKWVLTLAEYFKSQYGDIQGDFVTRKVISHCITNGNTLH